MTIGGTQSLIIQYPRQYPFTHATTGRRFRVFYRSPSPTGLLSSRERFSYVRQPQHGAAVGTRLMRPLAHLHTLIDASHQRV